MITLALIEPPLHDILKFSGVIARGCFIRQREMCLNNVMYVFQNQGRALLSFLRSGNVQLLFCPLHRRAQVTCEDFAAHFVAAQAHRLNLALRRLPAFDRVQNIDAVDVPQNAGVPVYSLQHAARGRGRGHVVADALHLHLRPCEAGVRPPEFCLNRHEIIPSFRASFFAKALLVKSPYAADQIIFACPSSGARRSPTAGS